MRALALAALLAGCTGGEPEDTGPPTVPLDPDVTSWSPEFAPLPQVARVVFLGDSITAGYGIANQEVSYTELLVANADDAWPGFAGDDLTARYGAPEVIDVSRSGAETPDILDRQIPNLDEALDGPASGPTLVFVTIGGNDMTGALVTPGALDTVADDIEANIREIATELNDPARFPDGVLLSLTNVYEPTDGEGQADQCFMGLDVSGVEPVLDDVNARTLALAQEIGFAWVDLRGHFRGHGWNHERTSMDAYDADDPTRWFQEDCIHPNKRGHHEIRRLFLAASDNLPLELWVP